jgi:hypothetical protein
VTLSLPTQPQIPADVHVRSSCSSARKHMVIALNGPISLQYDDCSPARAAC